MDASRPRFHSLDALRGLAALGVVLWHWQHFFSKGMGVPYHATSNPFYEFLFPLYRFGWLAVFLFFSLSGFIFFWLYAQSIAGSVAGRSNGSEAISVRRFFVLRFSRLYPLHLLTLLLVVAGQALFRHRHGFDFVYVHNDFYHFVLNLFMASFWGFEKGWSFNGPFWSVSVEVLLYALFFLFCRRMGPRASQPTWLLVTGLAGYFLITPWIEMVGKGFGAFFLGGFAYAVYTRLVKTEKLNPGFLRGAAFWISLATLSLAAAGFWARLRWPHLVWHAAWAHTGSPDWRLSELFVGFIALVVSPGLVLSVALLETAFGPVGAAARRLAWLGDLSYASYLLHFPLQLTFVLVTGALGVANGFYYSRGSLLLFFGILIPLSLAVHRAFERPAQRWLRRTLLARENG